ncbi:DNA/RNA non-specific endonuclease [Lonsdalea quercina]
MKEQSGLFAGQGGYNIKVGNHTQLDGAVIASTADKDKNLLDTGTLGWSDIHNQADYQSEHQSAGFSSGGSIGANLMSNMSALPIGNESSSGHAEGATKSAVSEGGLIIRHQTEQSQDVSQLDRDTENANEGAIDPIFDKEKEQKRLRQAQLVSDIASQSLDIYNTYESTKATHSETDKSVKTGVNAVVRALQALAGGDIKAALAQGAAPYLAEKVKEITTNNADYSTLTETQKLNNLMAHAILGGVVAELSGGNGTAGAIGAATGELAAPAIALVLYGTSDSKALTTQQKENISALATLASGIAGGVSSDSTAGAATGAQAGKNAVENNALSVQQNQDRAKEMTQCQGDAACKNDVIDKYKKINAEQHESVVNCSGAKDCVDKANEVGLLQADYAKRTSELLEKARTTGGLRPEEQDELSILQVTTIQLEADRNAAIHNALMSGDSEEAKQLAINSLAQAAGTSAAGIAAGVGKGSKLPASAEKNVVIVDSGKKGAWNKAMNKPEPNTVYKVDGDKTFHTDEQGRTSLAASTLSPTKNDRNGYQQCKAGKCGNTSDEGGHLIASIFNGPGEKLNIVPMDGNLNKGVWKSMENTWAKALKDGRQVDVKIEPVYSGNNKRPDSFNVTYSIDGSRPVIRDISNTPGGVK